MNMMSSHKEEDCMFYDSPDCLPSEDSNVLEFGYNLWLKEPQSVEQRRKMFRCRMGLSEFSSKDSSQVMELERNVQCSSEASLTLSGNETEESSEFCSREVNCGSNLSIDDELDREMESKSDSSFESEEQSEKSKDEVVLGNLSRKKTNWWLKRLLSKKGRKSGNEIAGSNGRVKVEMKKKKCMELSAVYSRQEIKAHNGLIWTMKFSPDGQYLASGGEDGVVRVWRITSTYAPLPTFTGEGDLSDEKHIFGAKKSIRTSIVIPEKIFHIQETPVQEFHGHDGDVLDLAWSNSNHLLSASMDKTVRHWRVGSDQCLNVYHHSNYVTCVEFNPVNENYFISGSIDGKARIWGVLEKRVVLWADAKDAITALCYQSKGDGFVVGTIAGTCRFYETSGYDVELEDEIRIQSSKKTYGNKITGIQVCPDDSNRVMITSDDSKLRIFDGVDLVCKFKGLPKSGSQMSASFTSSGQHIISVGEDNRVYQWNYNVPSSKHLKSMHSCEHLLNKGISVAVPWPGTNSDKSLLCLQSCTLNSKSERSRLGNWFPLDGSCRTSATWPEENLPEDVISLKNIDSSTLPATWGLVIVAAGCDGTIRTLHNYGLPCGSSQ